MASQSNNQMLLAIRFHSIDLNGGDVFEPEEQWIAKQQFINLRADVKEILLENHATLLDEDESGQIFHFPDINMAFAAAVAAQKYVDAFNALMHRESIYLLSIAIVAQVNPFTHGIEEIRSEKLASFLADTAGVGGIYLTEGAYLAQDHDKDSFCRFVKQLLPIREDVFLNIYEAFWNPQEIEVSTSVNIAHSEIQSEERPIRSFGTAFFLFVIGLFIAVLVMSVGLEPIWEFGLRVLAR
jgi:hypothetical protein